MCFGNRVGGTDRARRGFVAEVIDRLVDEVPRPHVLSVAAGHLREALLSSAVKRRKLGRFVALDSDADSVAEDFVLAGLGGRTVDQALADGVDAKAVWRAVCEAFDVPERLR